MSMACSRARKVRRFEICPTVHPRKIQTGSSSPSWPCHKSKHASTPLSNLPKILIKPSHHQPSGPTTIFSSQPSPPSPSHHRRKRRPPHRFATMPVSCNAPLARANKQDISTKKRNGDVLNVLKHATERYKIHHHEYMGYVCRHK